jgi:hypothetical protein
MPQVPLHRALAAAGHALVLAGRASATAIAPQRIYDRIAARPDHRLRVRAAIAPLAPVDIERELALIGHHFAGRAALLTVAALEDALSGVDLVVCDELDFGAIAAAQRAGIPTVVVSVIASGALVRPERLRDPLDELADRLGLPEAIRPSGDFFVVPFARRMRDPRFPAPADALWMRPEPGPAPDPDGSIVATLGTEFNTESGDLFDRILDALSIVGAPAVLAIGGDLDPARFAPPPRHVRIERFIDLGGAIARASAVVHHGGSGVFVRSVLGVAPQVVLPMGADQPFTADTVRRNGLGLVLDPITTTAGALADAVSRLLVDDGARASAAQLREAALALPRPQAVVERLEAALR